MRVTRSIKLILIGVWVVPEAMWRAKAVAPGRGMTGATIASSHQNVIKTNTCSGHRASMAVDVFEGGHLAEQREDSSGT